MPSVYWGASFVRVRENGGNTLRGSMRIGIIGTGAMASIFGGGLIEAGHDVVFVGKNAATVAALNERGLTVDRDGLASSHYAASAVLAVAVGDNADADAAPGEPPRGNVPVPRADAPHPVGSAGYVDRDRST